MITVYRLFFEEDFQRIYSDEKTSGVLFFDGSKMKETWNQPKSYFPYPTIAEPDFWCCFRKSSIFAVTEEIRDTIGRCIYGYCEMLPLEVEGRSLEIVNMNLVLNCLDREKSEYDPEYPDDIEKYAFHPKRFINSLFKIPETAMSELLCYEDSENPEDGFKNVVETEGLKGIYFEKLWSDED